VKLTLRRDQKNPKKTAKKEQNERRFDVARLQTKNATFLPLKNKIQGVRIPCYSYIPASYKQDIEGVAIIATVTYPPLINRISRGSNNWPP